MVEKYINSYVEVTTHCLEAMFGMSFSLSSEDSITHTNTFSPLNELNINIPFSGAISGDYFLSIKESEWAEYFLTALGDGSEEMINSCVKELLNTIVGDAIMQIQEDFADLTFLSPRIYRGQVDYPETKTMNAVLHCDGFSPIAISLCLNLMKQDIGLKLDEAVEATAKEKIKAQKAEAAVRSIMDNIQQGIFNINSEGIISPGCSKELTSLFKKDLDQIEDKSFDEACIAELVGNRKGSLKSWVEFVTSAPECMPWEDITELAPFHEERFYIGSEEFVYKFEYFKASSEDDLSIMIVIEDITEQKIIERQLNEARSEYESNLELLNNVMNLNSSELFSFLQECDNIMESVENISGIQSVDNETINKIFRGIHSLKGGAATLNFNNLSEIAHKVEDYLDEIRRNQDNAETSGIIQNISDIKSELNNIYTVVNRFNIQKHSHVPDTEKTITVNVSDLDKISADLSSTQDLNRGLTLIENLKTIPLNKGEATLQNMVQDLAVKLDKKVALSIDGSCRLPFEIFHRLSNPLIHLVRNSLDHGIETACERVDLGKPEIATVSIKGGVNNGEYEISIEDDGRGIQTEKIKDAALKKNLIQEGQELSEEETAMLIFHPGLSTKSEVSSISGRGVGLDSVKTSIEELGGNLTVKNNKNSGTVFTIKIPSQANKGAA